MEDTRLPCSALLFPDRTNLLAGLLGIPLIENVVERHHLQAGFGGRVHILLDGNEGHTKEVRGLRTVFSDAKRPAAEILLLRHSAGAIPW